MLIALTIPTGADADFDTPYRTAASHIAREFYLLYDLITSIVWVGQVALPLYFIGPTAFNGEPMWLTKINLVACIYFVTVSFFNIVEYWEARDKASEMIAGCVINIVFFSAIMWSDYKHIHKAGYENLEDQQTNLAVV